MSSSVRKQRGATPLAKRSKTDDLAAFKNAVSRFSKEDNKLQSIAQKAGIITPTGRLKKAYGG